MSTAAPKSPITMDDVSEDKVEISVARSISVAKRPGMMLVSGAAATETIMAEERLVEKRACTPMLVSVQKGHRHEKSQNTLVETM